MTSDELDERVEQHSAMWQSERDGYMLMPLDGTDGEIDYGIIDIRINHALIIENSDVAKRVKQKMLDAGVRVGNPFDIQVRKELIRERLKATRTGNSE